MRAIGYVRVSTDEQVTEGIRDDARYQLSQRPNLTEVPRCCQTAELCWT